MTLFIRSTHEEYKLIYLLYLLSILIKITMNNNNLSRVTIDDNDHDYDDPDDSELIVLDIANDINMKHSYFKRNDYKEYSVRRFCFINKIQEGNNVIWESSNKNECTYLVLFYDGPEKYIVIKPYDGNLILLRKKDDGSWINIKTNIDLKKLQMFERDVTCVKVQNFYFDLQKFNLKIIFDCFCHTVFYDGMLIYNHCDMIIHGYPYSLCLNLLDSNISIHLMDESTPTIHCVKSKLPEITYSPGLYMNENCYNTTHSTVKRELKDCKDEKVVKKVKLDKNKSKYICSYDLDCYFTNANFECDPVFLDCNMIMSTDKYVTYCSGAYKGFNSKKGFAFTEIINGYSIYSNSNHPENYSTQISTRRPDSLPLKNKWIDYKPRYPGEYIRCAKPDITMFEFYKAEDIEMSSDDYELSYDDVTYAIHFKTDLYKVIYDGKEYWNYINDKMNGFPSKIYFTDYNNDMNVCFNNGKIQKVKIKVHLLQFYTTDEFGNTVKILDKQYRATKTFRNRRLYKFKDGVKCTEIWHYELELVWKHKEGDKYPISVDYDNEIFSIGIRFDKYFIMSVRGSISMMWRCAVFQIPRNFKLYSLDENGNKVELNEKHYVLTCSHTGAIKYDIKEGVECDEIKVDGVTIFNYIKAQQYPYLMAYCTCMPSIAGLCSNLSIRCERKKGIWETNLTKVDDIREYGRKYKKRKLTN